MIAFPEISPSHPLQESSELNIPLTEIVLEIELLSSREEPSPNFRVECVGHDLGTRLVRILTDGGKLEEITTSDDLDLVRFLPKDIPVDPQKGVNNLTSLINSVKQLAIHHRNYSSVVAPLLLIIYTYSHQ